jgi:hypothetical protein
MAGALAYAAGPDNPPAAANASGAPPVLRRSEPVETVVFILPGLPAPPPRILKPFTDPPPVRVDRIPELPGAPEAILPASLPAATPVSPLDSLTAPKRAPLKPFGLSEPRQIAPESLPALPEMPAADPAKTESRNAPEALTALRRPPKAWFPSDFERDSAAYCQKRINEWSQPDAYNLMGAALRERPAAGENGEVAGKIYAFADPTGRYREIELDFGADTGLLRTVFVYPKAMTWTDVRKTWGTDVSSTEANKGRTFYSYTNRRLDVLVGPDGKVISLGLY